MRKCSPAVRNGLRTTRLPTRSRPTPRRRRTRRPTIRRFRLRRLKKASWRSRASSPRTARRPLEAMGAMEALEALEAMKTGATTSAKKAPCTGRSYVRRCLGSMASRRRVRRPTSRFGSRVDDKIASGRGPHAAGSSFRQIDHPGTWAARPRAAECPATAADARPRGRRRPASATARAENARSSVRLQPDPHVAGPTDARPLRQARPRGWCRQQTVNLMGDRAGGRHGGRPPRADVSGRAPRGERSRACGEVGAAAGGAVRRRERSTDRGSGGVARPRVRRARFFRPRSGVRAAG